MTETSFWRLYSLESLRGVGAPVDWDDSMDMEQVTCPLTKDHMGGGARIGDLSVELPSLRIGDIAWTWGSSCMIQRHVLEAFRSAGFSGFDVRPVTITKVRRRPRGQAVAPKDLPKLWELLVTGWAGEAAPESGIRMRYYCEGCGLVEYTAAKRPARLIDRRQWDGSDFFIVWPLPKFMFVTERVAELIRAEQYTGCRLVRPADLDLSGGFSPGPAPPGRKVRGPEAFPKVRIRRWPKTRPRPAT